MLLYHWNLELSDIPKKNRDEGEDAMEMGKEGKRTLFEYEHFELHYSGLYMKQLEYRRC